VQELLAVLSARLTEMTGGRAEAFASALDAYPADQRFSLPALAEVLWPSLENLRHATAAPISTEAVESLVRQHEAPLAALYLRHSGRSRLAWEATRTALLRRLPALYVRYALWASAHDGGALRKLLQTPEGVAIVVASLGLVTLRMPISTPLVCAVLSLVGYAGLAPILQRVQGRLKDTIFQALAEEDAVIARLGQVTPAPTLTELLTHIRPALTSAVLGGEESRDELMTHADPVLSSLLAMERDHPERGQAYAHAVKDVIRTRFLPRFVAIVASIRSTAEGSLMRRLLQDPNGAGLCTLLATAPISLLAAQVTPWGWYDAPLMGALFFLAGRTACSILTSPARQLSELEVAMHAEERLLSQLHAGPPADSSLA
jgi:hypothetical protein